MPFLWANLVQPYLFLYPQVVVRWGVKKIFRSLRSRNCPPTFKTVAPPLFWPNPIQSNPWMNPIHVQLWEIYTAVVSVWCSVFSLNRMIKRSATANRFYCTAITHQSTWRQNDASAKSVIVWDRPMGHHSDHMCMLLWSVDTNVRYYRIPISLPGHRIF